MAITKLDDTGLARVFFRTAWERQSIWTRRQTEAQGPWTADPILGEWWFHNVFRELDTHTQQLMTLAAEADLPPGDIVFNVWLWRVLDHWPAWTELTGGSFVARPLDEGTALMERLNEMRAEKRQVFTSRHLSPAITAVARMMPYMVRLSPAVAQRVGETEDMESVFDTLSALPGVGKFLADQIGQDLSLLRVTRASLDRWIHVGPSAMTGLELVYGYRIMPRTAVQAVKVLRDEQSDRFKALGLDFLEVAAPGFERLTLSAVAHWLPELVKYSKMEAGTPGKIKYSAGSSVE